MPFILTIIIKSANHPEILKFLISQGANIEGRTGFGKTALFYAIQLNNFASVKALIENGANINAFLMKAHTTHEETWKYYSLTKVIEFTPLAYSIRYGSAKITKYLVEK